MIIYDNLHASGCQYILVKFETDSNRVLNNVGTEVFMFMDDIRLYKLVP